MDAELVKERTIAALRLLQGAKDELGDLDQALGDGDLGITVSAGSAAVIGALKELDEPSVSEILTVAGRAFATANPSTFAALVGSGLLACAKATTGQTAISRSGAAEIAAVSAETIAKRGKSKVGDKTILDALSPVAAVLKDPGIADDDVIEAAIAAAQHAVNETAGLQSQKGRAAWTQERSIGLQDPGATAFLRFLECWRDAAE